jgi:hexosaminidase
MLSYFLSLIFLSFIPSSIAGTLWPKPQNAAFSSTYLSVDSSTFSFQSVGYSSSILDQALIRAKSFSFVRVPPTYPVLNASISGNLLSIQINVLTDVSVQTLGVSENYTLVVPSDGVAAVLTADTVFDALRGLNAFYELFDWALTGSLFIIPSVTIVDFPRFPHRGFMIDTARHYIDLQTLKAAIDAASYNNFNVFHWHIVDSQSFPYYSMAFPSLSGNGSWNAPLTTHVYFPNDVNEIITYAEFRGIRVIPEFDTPGHSLSWGPGIPGLLTPCYTNGEPDGTFGPINPISNVTWPFLTSFFTEVASVFRDSYFHIGGDEVDFTCWASNPEIQQFMTQEGFGANYTLFESYYLQKLLNLVGGGLNRSYIGWQEIFDNGLQLLPETVVHAWKGGATAPGLLELEKITKAGFKGILSAGWYLNYISYGEDWFSYYNANPTNFSGTPAQKALVLGGEAAIWGEYVDSSNLISRFYPRASAVAERLWSSEDTVDLNDAAYRLHDHRCRMIARGISAEVANGPSFCPVEYVPQYLPPWTV